MSEIKRCPFCPPPAGDRMEVIFSKSSDWGAGYVVMCLDCGAMGPGVYEGGTVAAMHGDDVEAAAIARWNDAASKEEIARKDAALREAVGHLNDEASEMVIAIANGRSVGMEPCGDLQVDLKLREELAEILNCNSAENGSDTPDFILAKYLTGCLDAFDRAFQERTEWYDRQRVAERDQTAKDFPGGGPA